MATDRRVRRALHALAVASFAAASLAWGHETLVFGTVTAEPAPPTAGEPFVLTLELSDPDDAPVTDAVVTVEAHPVDAAGPHVQAGPLDETAPGRYATELVLGEDGAWTLVFQDRTDPQEDARAEVTLELGRHAPAEPVSFLFPPTGGPPSIVSWLAWLVGLPLLAGGLLTVLVLRSSRETTPPEATPPAAPAPDRLDGEGPEPGRSAGRATGEAGAERR